MLTLQTSHVSMHACMHERDHVCDHAHDPRPRPSRPRPTYRPLATLHSPWESSCRGEEAPAATPVAPARVRPCSTTSTRLGRSVLGTCSRARPALYLPRQHTPHGTPGESACPITSGPQSCSVDHTTTSVLRREISLEQFCTSRGGLRGSGRLAGRGVCPPESCSSGPATHSSPASTPT